MLSLNHTRSVGWTLPLLISALWLPKAVGFFVHKTTSIVDHSHGSRLYAQTWENVPSDADYDHLDELQELEQARTAFESLLASDDSSAEQVLLTDTGRYRRQLEIDLLESLVDSDDAIDELEFLWMHEQSPAVAAQLEAMQGECSDGLVVEQALLERLCRDHPDWAEPAIRLATLYYYKGHSQDALDTCQRGLELKPWHFEGHSLLVLLALRHDDLGQAVRFARNGLPPLLRNDGQPSARRQAWVTRAVQQAKEQWHHAEQVTRAFRERNLLDNSASSEQPEEEQVWQ